MTAASPEIIAAYNAGRDPSRLALKLVAMRDNPFSFLRGTAHLFHQRMAEAGIDTGGPPTWICGDLHLENFGTYLASNGLTYFDINDFDECALAPCSWDILRLATSLLVAAPLYDIKRAAAVALATQAIAAYRNELATGKPRWIERKTADGVIGDLIDSLRHRNPEKFVQKRTVDKRSQALDTALPKMQAVMSGQERRQVSGFIESRTVGAKGPQEFRFLDVAYRIAGTGSLGVCRYVVLAETLTDPSRKLLLDLKGTLPSSVQPVSGISQPPWNNEAHRVVAVQNLAQVLPPGLLQAVSFGGQSFVFKELQPTSDRLDLDEVAKDADQFSRTITTMGELTAWAHLRASGHLTSAPSDALVAFAQDKAVAKAILLAAQDMETSTHDDYAAYCEAYDAGAFAATLAHLDKAKGDEAA
ncbi:MAG: DUF2252 family protein [Hyphomicrobiaceae bacterium]|nr:DUF2252 family protein [Hyphomicrobiaceae bacterium]